MINGQELLAAEPAPLVSNLKQAQLPGHSSFATPLPAQRLNGIQAGLNVPVLSHLEGPHPTGQGGGFPTQAKGLGKMNPKLIYSANSLNELCLSTDSTQLWAAAGEKSWESHGNGSRDAAIPPGSQGQDVCCQENQDVTTGNRSQSLRPCLQGEAKPGFPGCRWCWRSWSHKWGT